jgi:hypothetical protein
VKSDIGISLKFVDTFGFSLVSDNNNGYFTGSRTSVSVRRSDCVGNPKATFVTMGTVVTLVKG